MRRHAAATVVLLLVLNCSLPAAAHTQVLDRTAVSGTVYDPTGAVVPGIEVHLLHVDVGLERVVHADTKGRFTARLLPIGPYRIRARNDSLVSPWHELRLHLGEAVSLDLYVTVAGITDTVDVSAAWPSTSAAVSTVIERDRVVRLPTRGRDYREFALLAPTVMGITGTRGTLRVAGQPGDYLALLVDGADFTNALFGEFTGSLETRNVTIPIEAVEEFQVRGDN